MSNLLIAGAKGFAKELLEAVLQLDAEAEVVFYDDVSDDLPERLFDRFSIVRNMGDLTTYFSETSRDFALGVGDPNLRAEFFEKFVSVGGRPKTIISPFAKIGIIANRIGDGACVLSDAVIESNNEIGKGTLIHVGALVSHDVIVGDFCEISPRANLLGSVKIGNRCRIGTASTLLPNVKLGDAAVVGAGAVVTKDIADGATVVGVPARPV
jgi:sugar O-acyltransferase (sialic acid O-acetyltransferase NeuD family)